MNKIWEDAHYPRAIRVADMPDGILIDIDASQDISAFNYYREHRGKSSLAISFDDAAEIGQFLLNLSANKRLVSVTEPHWKSSPDHDLLFVGRLPRPDDEK